MASRPLIKESLLLLNICGINPYIINTWSKARATVVLTLLLIVEFNVLLELIVNWNGLNSMQVLAVSFGIYQVIFKVIITLMYRTKFVKVINKMENFWPIDQCSVDLQTKIARSYKFVTKLAKFMIIMIFCVALAFEIKPGRQLPFKAYYPADLSKSPDYQISFGLQSLMMFFGIIALIGLDGLFFSLVINITSEIKMLNEAFKAVSINHECIGESEETLVYLYRLIDHHNLVLECIKDVRKIYSIPLLNVYFYSTALMSLSMLSIIASGFPPTLETLNLFGSLAIFYGLQLYFYCAIGSHLKIESEKVSAVIYSTKWWIKTQPELRRAYVLIIMRANKMERLVAGGMFTLNLESFSSVIKNTLSLFTLVQAMYKK